MNTLKAMSGAMRIGRYFIRRGIGALAGISAAAISAAATAESAPESQSQWLQQLTGAIDARTALLVSIISILLLAWVWRADFKGSFGIWGGRLIIFILVVSNIFLWSTQI